MVHICDDLPPTKSEERKVLGAGSSPVTIPPHCQEIKSITL